MLQAVWNNTHRRTILALAPNKKGRSLGRCHKGLPRGEQSIVGAINVSHGGEAGCGGRGQEGV